MKNLSKMYFRKRGNRCKTQMWEWNDNPDGFLPCKLNPIFASERHFISDINDVGFCLKKVSKGKWVDLDFKDEFFYRGDVVPSYLLNEMNKRDWNKFQKFLND